MKKKGFNNYGPNSNRARTVALTLKAMVAVAGTSTFVTGHLVWTLIIAIAGAALNEIINIYDWDPKK